MTIIESREILEALKLWLVSLNKYYSQLGVEAINTHTGLRGPH